MYGVINYDGTYNHIVEAVYLCVHQVDLQPICRYLLPNMQKNYFHMKKKTPLNFTILKTKVLEGVFFKIISEKMTHIHINIFYCEMVLI